MDQGIQAQGTEPVYNISKNNPIPPLKLHLFSDVCGP